MRTRLGSESIKINMSGGSRRRVHENVRSRLATSSCSSAGGLEEPAR